MVQAPDLAYNLQARLDIPTGDLPFDAYTVVAYTWQDDKSYSMLQDPLAVQEDYGLLDLTLALEDRDGQWKLTFFGKNLTDEHYYTAMGGSAAYAGQGRLSNRVGRGSQTYWGMTARWNFF
jgi:iron complex outermembrane receptor protein